MSRKLATTIKDSRVPGKWKRVLEAYAAFANNDGSNIFAAKPKLAAKAGAASPDTIYRNTPDLLACGILKVAKSHTCRVPNCNKGATHFTGKWGHYTTVYEIDISFLQNAETHLSSKYEKVRAAKCRKVGTANCGTTQAFNETPAPAAPPLGTETDSSAVHTADLPTDSPTDVGDQAGGPHTPEPSGQDGVEPEEKQTYPRHPDRAKLHLAITPNLTGRFSEELVECDAILDWGYPLSRLLALLEWNRAHEKGKWFIRSAAQFRRAIETGNLINNYDTHPFETCPTCKKADIEQWTLESAEPECRQCSGPANLAWDSIPNGQPHYGYCGPCWSLMKPAQQAAVKAGASKAARAASVGKGFDLEEAE